MDEKLVSFTVKRNDFLKI